MAKKRVAKRMKKSGRDLPIQNVVNTGPAVQVGATSTSSLYVNAAHLLSMMNRRSFHQVTSAGHLKNYGLEIQVFNMTNASTTVYTAALSYPTYNATRAWHFARKDRYEDAGFKLSELGYGERLRFALDKDMSDINQSTGTGMIKPSNLANSIADKGEWDWSEVIITPPTKDNTWSQTGATGSDSFVLHLCGDHTVETDNATYKYSHVGMVQSWTENRRGIALPADSEVVQAENPLAFTRLSETSSHEMTEEVADEQKQSPPYANADSDSGVSPFAETVVQGQLETSFPNPTTNNDMIIAPGGVAKISITNNHNEAQFAYLNLRIVELD